MGTGVLGRELEANRELTIVVLVCAELALCGVHFTIENPLSSYAYRTELFQCLNEAVDISMIDFDQCLYGLTFPDCGEGAFCKKPTRIAGTSQAFHALHARCPGTEPGHTHVRAWGSVKIEGKSSSRTGRAGRCPPDLCRRWAQAVRVVVKVPAQVLDRPHLAALRDKVRGMLR